MADTGNDRPNVLVILSDQHSKHMLGAYGSSVVRTPNLDALAARGMRFESCYCPSPLCVPSRMSFMTGRTPSRNRCWSNHHTLSSAIPTWAHAMGVAGYETALVGRMHFIGPDQRHGFEKRPIGESFAGYLGAPRLGGPLFGAIPGSTSGQIREGVEISGYGTTTYQALDDLVTDTACEYLAEKANGSGSRPFAAVVGYVLPHCPFFCPKDLFDYYYERVDVPEHEADVPAAVRKFRRLRGIEEPLSAERVRIARAAYFGLCEYMDRNIGRVLDALSASGLTENTLVVYASDHGESAGEHGCWWKANYYESSVGVPLIAALPGLVREGSESPRVCNLMDLGPTFLDLAHGPAMPDIDGRSLVPLFQGGEAVEWCDETVSEHVGGWYDDPSRMVRSGPWKLYRYHDQTPPVLYNLDDDPGEMHDLAGDPAFSSVRDRLLARLNGGWEPERVLEECRQLGRDAELLSRWGAAVKPRHPDALEIPFDVEDVTVV